MHFTRNTNLSNHLDVDTFPSKKRGISGRRRTLGFLWEAPAAFAPAVKVSLRSRHAGTTCRLNSDAAERCLDDDGGLFGLQISFISPDLRSSPHQSLSVAKAQRRWRRRLGPSARFPHFCTLVVKRRHLLSRAAIFSLVLSAGRPQTAEAPACAACALHARAANASCYFCCSGAPAP